MNSTLVNSLIGGGCVLFGLVCLLVGYRLFRVLSGIIGFIISGTVGYVFVYYFITPSVVPSAIVGSIVGAIGGALFTFFLPAGVFAMGSFLGFCLSLFIISLSTGFMEDEDDSRDIVLVSLSLAGGLLALRFWKPAVVGCTSLVGGYGVVAGIDMWIGSGFNTLYNSILDRGLASTHFSGLLVGIIAAWVVISVIGIVMQYKVTAKDIVMENNKRVTSFFGRKKGTDEDNVPLLEVITYLDDENY